MRFSDHRGLLPSDVKCSGGSLQTKLSPSKTLGADREVQSRLVYIDQACFIALPERLMQGWDLLTSIANFKRDYLLPSPSENFQGCIHKELRYDTAFAIQHRVLLTLTADGEQLFAPHMPQFWTPHSGRTFLPSAAAALGCDKAERDFLGGWSAQGSDVYARVAKRRIAENGCSLLPEQSGPHRRKRNVGSF